jgi:hypothetical protein
METLVWILDKHPLWLGLPIGTICVALKVWILYHCPSHPLYRGQ